MPDDRTKSVLFHVDRQLTALIASADAMGDYVLAAKLAEAQTHIAIRLPEAAD